MQENSWLCKCDEGYHSRTENGLGPCQDTNECIMNLNKCAKNSKCFNTPGSYQCSCDLGFTGNAEMLCLDVDECGVGQHNCDEQSAACINTVGSFDCKCRVGYRLVD